MIVRNTFTAGFLALALFGCGEAPESSDKKETDVSIESDQETDAGTAEPKEEKVTPTILSFTEKSTFTISKKNAGMNEATGTDNYDVYLNNQSLKSPIKLGCELSVLEIKPGTSGVPANAVFAYNTWFAGGGEVYYGVVNNGVLQINVKYEDEGMTTPGQFSLYREIDPNVQTPKPDYYISYSSDDKKSKELMIAFSEKGKALFAKYYGQSRHINLEFTKDESSGRNIVELYDEIVNGETNGTYKLTHSGNWDYAQYTNKKSGKKFNFTINHNVTIMNDTYRTVPSL